MSIMTRHKSLPKGIVHGCLVWILAQMPSITNRTEPQFSFHKIVKHLKRQRMTEEQKHGY